MRLRFGEEEWLHVLMAVRIAQKVLTKGEYYTPAYDHACGYRIIGELMRLIKIDPNAPQVATKIDALALLDAMPAPKPAPGDEVVARAGVPEPSAPGDAPFNGLDIKTPEPAQATPVAEGIERRLAALEAAVNQALQGLTQSHEDIGKLTDAHNTLAQSVHERFLAVDEYVYAIEDKLAAFKKGRAG